MAFVHYRTRGFIFKKNDRFEADRFFTIFTCDFGRIEVVGRAIRKITSKLRAGTELFYLSEIEFIQGKTYKTLTDTVVLEKFENIRKNLSPHQNFGSGDLEKLKIAFKISKVLDNFLRFEEKDKRIWDLIVETFSLLDNKRLTEPTHLSSLFHYFLWNFFSILGYQPELFRCAICQKKLTFDGLYFSTRDGGVICSVCAKSKEEATRVNSDAVKILRIILKRDWQTLSRLKIEPVSQKLLKNISESYYSNLLRKQ